MSWIGSYTAAWLNDEKAFKVHPGETVLLKVRKHWFILVRDVFLTLVGGILGVILAIMTIRLIAISVVPAVILFALSLWLIMVWIAIMTIWTTYYLDMWVVTDERIVYSEQVSLFSRDITTIQLERVQDATIKYTNFIETILDFGLLRIQTASTNSADMEMYGIPHPEAVRQLVLNQVDQVMRRRGAHLREAARLIANP